MPWPIDIIDVAFYLLRLRWVFLLVIAVIILNILSCIFFRNFLDKYSRWQKILPSLLMIFILIVVIIVTAREGLLLTMLGSEDDAVVEQAYFSYKQRAKISNIIQVIIDGEETDNVRFYLARMLGEILPPNFSIETNMLLKKLERAPLIDPKFIGQNQLNEGNLGFNFPTPPISIVRYYYTDILRE